MKILYVDDEPGMRDVIGRVLTKLGFEVETVSNGPDAISRLQGAHGLFDAVVTDLSMPEMSGTQLAQAVKDFAPDLPIIAFTGSALQYLQSADQTRLFAAVVRKGPQTPALREAILQAVGDRAR
jgi:two-component system, cell cycle sensor histidine kinase and response regulator CckA